MCGVRLRVPGYIIRVDCYKGDKFGCCARKCLSLFTNMQGILFCWLPLKGKIQYALMFYLFD